MTRKDYILIARALRNTMDDAGKWERPNWRPAVVAVALRLTDELAHDNPRFSRDHFLAVVRGEKALESRPPR